MKNTLTVLSLVILVWGCAKKMTPAPSTAPASNSGSAIQSQSPNTDKQAPTTAAANTNTTPTAAVGGPTGTIQAAAPKPEEAALIAGQQTFNAKCGRCHAYKATIDYTADRWASILSVMAPRANLTETEKANVYAYVKANSKK
jgi:hypothetical protein